MERIRSRGEEQTASLPVQNQYVEEQQSKYKSITHVRLFHPKTTRAATTQSSRTQKGKILKYNHASLLDSLTCLKLTGILILQRALSLFLSYAHSLPTVGKPPPPSTNSACVSGSRFHPVYYMYSGVLCPKMIRTALLLLQKLIQAYSINSCILESHGPSPATEEHTALPWQCNYI